MRNSVSVCAGRLTTIHGLSPSCVAFTAGEQEGLDRDCVARADFVMTVDKVEIDFATGKLGVIDEERMRDLIRAIGHVIEAECEPE